LVLVWGQAKAQRNIQQVTFGGGSGIAMAYTGTVLQKMTVAFYSDVAFYPLPYININLEAQAGLLSGASLNKKNRKSFNNNYQAAIINVELQAGMFIAPYKNSFLDRVRNFYAGTGYGLIHSEISNVNIINTEVTDHITNTLHIVPVKLGYEFGIIKNSYDEPILRANLSFTLNYINQKGLDGYYDAYAKSGSFYNYYAIGLRYAIILRHGRSKSYLQ